MVLQRDVTCARCGQTIPAGSRAEKSGPGNWGRCIARGWVQHASGSSDCRPTPLPIGAQRPTERQLAFAGDLIRRDPGTAGGVTVQQLHTQTREQVSEWIDLQIRLQDSL